MIVMATAANSGDKMTSAAPASTMSMARFQVGSLRWNSISGGSVQTLGAELFFTPLSASEPDPEAVGSSGSQGPGYV